MRKRSIDHRSVNCFSVILVAMLCLNTTLIAQRSDSEIFIHGADGSVLDKVEQSGGMYYDDGVEKNALEIFKKYGFNLIRLKLWHTPEEPYNGLPSVLDMAKRVKAAGFDFMLDFHYSDTWADPGHQTKPAAWEGLSFEVLADSVYEYSKFVISKLQAQNTLPEYVQIGNEISCGMLWDNGKICGEFATYEQWEKLGILIKKGIQGVKYNLNNEEEIKIIIHFDNGANNIGCQWFFTNILNEEIDFDIIGLSFYPWWHGTLTELEDNLNDLSTRYQKEIMLVEGAYPWTLSWGDNTGNIIGNEGQLHEGYPATVEGQKDFLEELLDIVKNAPDDRGIGFVYWSPEWIPGYPGSPWENLALFDFEGEVLESIKVFQDQSDVNEGIIYKPFTLGNPYPIPANTITTIEFSMNKTRPVEMTIFDAFGREVTTLVDEELITGDYQITWNTMEQSSGVYYVVFQSDGFQQIRKIVVR